MKLVNNNYSYNRFIEYKKKIKIVLQLMINLTF